ncbi:MAG TPA: PD-(D/E)XK nuclease family transposase, partial [Lachnospiraceae bacterium]|nr:PD-(D/E)XK nuclease family transposase [Lachnospiraceae bacterium]
MKNSTLLQNATGPVEYKLTNDYLFRAVFQKNTHVLKGLICSLLNLKEAEIQSVEIQNPIKLGESFEEKDIILDLNILLNNAQRLNIEMQV